MAGITNSRAALSFTVNKLIHFGPVASVLSVTVCSELVRDRTVHPFVGTGPVLGVLQTEYKGNTRVVPKVMSNFFFLASELGTTDEGECGGRWNQLLCYP